MHGTLGAFLATTAETAAAALLVALVVAVVKMLRSIGKTADSVAQLAITVGELSRDHAHTRERLAMLEGAARWPVPGPPWNGR